MTLVSANVRVAVTGAVSIGATTAAAPTDADSPLGSGWTDLDYVSDDGVTETRDRSTEQIKAWQNAAIVREVVTEATLTYQLTLIETKKETVELYYGAVANSADGSLAIIPRPPVAGNRSCSMWSTAPTSFDAAQKLGPFECAPERLQCEA